MATIDISRIGGEEQRSELPVDIKLRQTSINHDCAGRKLVEGNADAE
ncbi:TPA: hypothetical protein ACPZUG_004304 [Yersinia enterocolitica]